MTNCNGHFFINQVQCTSNLANPSRIFQVACTPQEWFSASQNICSHAIRSFKKTVSSAMIHNITTWLHWIWNEEQKMFFHIANHLTNHYNLHIGLLDFADESTVLHHVQKHWCIVKHKVKKCSKFNSSCYFDFLFHTWYPLSQWYTIVNDLVYTGVPCTWLNSIDLILDMHFENCILHALPHKFQSFCSR